MSEQAVGSVGPGYSRAGVLTHFGVPAREMLFDQPVCCPVFTVR